MNAIYGSNSKDKFLELQKLSFGKTKLNTSMLLLSEERFDIYKTHAISKGFKFPRKKYHTYLGITENKTKHFIPENMNPFMGEKWLISCCGDISNVDEVVDLDKEGFPKNIIQTHAIHALFYYIENGRDCDDVEIISDALSLLEGKYSAWLHNTENRNTYIVKCNSELYADVYENTFSTFPFKGGEPLRDGEIYLLTKEGITHIGDCDCSVD